MKEDLHALANEYGKDADLYIHRAAVANDRGEQATATFWREEARRALAMAEKFASGPRWSTDVKESANA